MEIIFFALGPLETNCYLLHSDTEAIIIDPGGDPESVLLVLEEKQLTLTHILLTHMHFDHAYGCAALQEATKAPIFLSPDDAFLRTTQVGMGGAFGMPLVAPFPVQDMLPGASTLLGTQCQVVATPGHTPGGLSFYFPEAGAVFVGDTLFCRGVGRTDLPGGEHAVLMNSINKTLFSLPDATRVYPGHGPETSINDEKLHNPFCSHFAV